MRIFSKEELIQALADIKQRGWIRNARVGNAGGIGNTLEDLLGIDENNLPIPNAANWELKCQRKGTTSLVTLCHKEPSPRALRFVPQVLLPNYGWPHDQAGIKYPHTEMSFRQTINALTRTDRGFGIRVDRSEQKILVSFDASSVSPKHAQWLRSVDMKVGLDELNPQPYWGFQELYHSIGSKLSNVFYVQAQVQKIDGEEYYLYDSVMILSGFSLESLLSAIEQGILLVDFDARSGHNHGTKFRIRQNNWPALYSHIEPVV